MLKRLAIVTHMTDIACSPRKGRPTHRGGLWVMVLFATLVYVLHALLNDITFNSVTKYVSI